MSTILSVIRKPVPVFAGVLRDRRGAVAVLLAIALSALVGFAGLGSEVAGWYYTQRSMQSAADATAMSAAAELAANTSTTSTQLQDQGNAIAASYNFTNGTNNVTVTINNPPASGSYASCPSAFTGTNCYVEVIISQPQTALLSALFLSSGPTITGRAVALANISAADAGCVLTLNKHPVVDLSISGNVNLNLSTCALYDNSSDRPGALSMSGNATVNAKAAYIVGTIETNGGASLNTTDGTFTGTNPINDPYAGVAVPSYSGCNQTNYSKSGQQSDSISAGTTPYVFCNGLKLTGQSSLTLGPGVYIIDQGTLDLSGGTTLTATGGVTIVLTNHSGGSPADIKISGGATVNIVAPTTGSTKGIALFQDRVACSSCSDQITGGGTMNITGAIYFPSNSLTFTGGASAGGAQCTQLIASAITFTGNSNLQTNCSSAGTKTINATNGTLVM